MPPLRGDLRQRRQDEAPLVHRRMRQSQRCLIQHKIVIEEQIEVERAGPFRWTRRAVTSKTAFDPEQRV